MKRKLFLLCAAALTLGGRAGARQLDLSRARTGTATLVSYARHGQYDKSVFDFRHGVRGDKKSKASVRPSVVSLKGLPGNDGLMRVDLGGGSPRDVQETGNPYRRASGLAPGATPDGYAAQTAGRTPRFDIRYGGLTWNGTSEWLEVVDRRGTRSVIKDLGAVSWSEVTTVPVLPPSPEPHGSGVQFRNRRIVSPENVFVRAVAGHMYALRVKDAKTDYHVVFRVESLDPNGECRLTWKRVPTPKN